MKRTRIFLSRKAKKERHNVRESESESESDRLSDLPDSILVHIMSFMKIKDAVQTCVLSKRWNCLWRWIPNLTLHTSDFSKHVFFSEFVAGIVSSREGDDYPLHNLDFYRHGYFSPKILTNLMRYAVSHRLQQLKIYVPYNIGFPSFVLSCQSLLSLDVSVSSYDIKRRTRIPPRSMELPALTSLRLENVAICTDRDGIAEPFSGCKKLRTLCIDGPVLISCYCAEVNWAGTLVISNAKLATLTIDNYSDFKIEVCTPELTSFALNGSPFQELRGKEGINIELQSPSSLG